MFFIKRRRSIYETLCKASFLLYQCLLLILISIKMNIITMCVQPNSKNVMPDHNDIEKLVSEVLTELMQDFDVEAPASIGAKTILYGTEGLLDSMALVNLIADLEERVYQEYQKTIVLADEKAMSSRNSPFASIQSLTQAILERLG